MTSIGAYTIEEVQIRRSLEMFRNYKNVGLLQKRVVNYIVEELFSPREADSYLMIFYVINTPSDGMCNKEQFIKAFWSLGITEMNEHELDNLLAYIDDDRNGYVTFQEFLMACVHPDDLLAPEKLD